MQIILQADSHSAAHRNRNRHGRKLGATDAAKRPQRAGGEILEHGRHVTQAALRPGDIAQNDIQVAGRWNDLLAEQIVGVIDHAQIKDLQLRQDPPLRHAPGQLPNNLRAVH